MPTSPYAKALVSVNAAATVFGGVTVPSAASVAFTGENTTGWQSQRWELYDYPVGWGTPTGWSIDASGVVFSTAVAPQTIALPANTTLWGKWALRLTVTPVNGGGVTLVDEATMLSMLSPKGQRSLAFNETSQFGGPRRLWAGEYQANQIAIEALLAATAGVPGGSSGQFQFNNASVFGGTANLSYAGGGLVVNSSGFVSFGTTPAGAGYLRYPSAGGSVLTLLGIKNTSAVDTPIIRTGAGDVVTFGNFGQDVSLVSTVNGFIAFGSGGASTGLIRLKSGASSSVLTIDDGIGGTRSPLIFVNNSGGPSLDLGIAAFNTNVTGSAIAVVASTKTVLSGDGTTLYLGTNSGFSVQHVNTNIAASGTVQFAVGATTYVYCAATTAATEFSRPVSGLVVSPDLNGLRLTVTTGTPLPTVDVATASTIYLTPFRSGSLALYSASALSGSVWYRRDTAEISLALSGLTAGKNYDVFAYWTGSAVALELSAAWTSDTARLNALALQDGVWSKAADLTRRYVGTFRAISTTQTTDTQTQRFLYNEYNQFDRHLLVVDATASWAYASTTVRQARATASNRVEVVVGQPRPVAARLDTQNVPSTAGLAGIVGVGLDSTTAYAANSRCNYGTGSGVGVMSNAIYNDVLTTGYHALNWLESCTAATSVTFTGTGSGQASSLSARVPM